MTELEPPDLLQLEAIARASDTSNMKPSDPQSFSGLMALTSILFITIAFIQMIMLDLMTNPSYERGQAKLNMFIFILGYATIYLVLVGLSLGFSYLLRINQDAIVSIVSTGYAVLVLINTVLILLGKWYLTYIVFLVGSRVFMVLIFLTVVMIILGIILNILEKLLFLTLAVGSYIRDLYQSLNLS